jgi:hypothetical protein
VIPGFASLSEAVRDSFPPDSCRLVAVREHGDAAVALFDTRPSAAAYLYEVHYHRDAGKWSEGSSGNGSGWHRLHADSDLGVVTAWDEAPPGADRVRLELEGRAIEEAVVSGVYFAVWWDVPQSYAQVTAFRTEGEWVPASTITQSSHPRPARSYFLLTGLMPFAAVLVAAIMTGMSAITAFASFIATLGAMAAAGTFVMSWERPSGRSQWRSRFVLWLHEPRPNRLQHWYVPVVAGATAGGLSEAARAVIVFSTIGTRLSSNELLTALVVGILEGLMIALSFGAGLGIAGFVRPKFQGVPPT